MKSCEKILLVDDEPRVLEALLRSLRSDFRIEVAESPAEGLEMLTEDGPFAVVVSDLRMPGMDGMEFLNQVRSASPDTIRIILSGHADMDAALTAVNENNIFRFLRKPCAVSVLARALSAAVAQYRLVTAEHELLQKTLMGAVTVLTDILAVVYPAAFRRSARVTRYVKLLAQALKLADPWQFEVAAMLSQIGCITLPLVTADKIHYGENLSADEGSLFARHPEAAKALLRSIPRLGPAAEMIAAQQQPYRWHENQAGHSSHVVVLGAQMLHLAIELDRVMGEGSDFQEALERMNSFTGEFNPELLRVMAELGEPATTRCSANVGLHSLAGSLVSDDDIRATNRLLFVAKDNATTPPS